MKKIGIDLDDVLLNFCDSFLEFHNENYGTNFKREDNISNDVEKLWGITNDELRQRFVKFYESDHHKNARPVDGAVEAISELALKNKLHIITASPENVKDELMVWLNKHFKDKFEGIHFTKKHVFDQIRNKGEMCLELGIEVFIDDSLNNAANISAVGIPVFLFNTPWNQSEVGPLIKRVYSWKEIVEDLNK